MRIYISGSISGTSDYQERFEKAEKELTEKGFSVINPAKVNSNLPPDTTYDEYMKASLCLLSMCDCIYMLKGWEKSNGAKIEFNQSHEDNRPVLFETVDFIKKEEE